MESPSADEYRTGSWHLRCKRALYSFGIRVLTWGGALWLAYGFWMRGAYPDPRSWSHQLADIGQGVLWGLAAASCWLVFSLGYHLLAYKVYYNHIYGVLTDSGVVYYTFEHDTHALIAPLLSGRSFLAPPQASSVLSFRDRVDRLVSRYPAIARRLGLQPYPARARILESSLLIAFILLAGILFSFGRPEMTGAMVNCIILAGAYIALLKGSACTSALYDILIAV